MSVQLLSPVLAVLCPGRSLLFKADLPEPRTHTHPAKPLPNWASLLVGRQPRHGWWVPTYQPPSQITLSWLPRVVSGIPGFLCGNKSFLWPPGVGCEFVPVTTAKAGFWLWEQHFRQLLIPISTDLPKFQMPPWRSILKSCDSAM